MKEALENSKSVLATKEDLFGLRSELKEDIASLRDELKGDIHALRVELKGDNASLDVKIEKTRADMIKWMFIFWISQLAAIFAMLRFLID